MLILNYLTLPKLFYLEYLNIVRNMLQLMIIYKISWRVVNVSIQNTKQFLTFKLNYFKLNIFQNKSVILMGILKVYEVVFIFFRKTGKFSSILDVDINI